MPFSKVRTHMQFLILGLFLSLRTTPFAHPSCPTESCSLVAHCNAVKGEFR